VGFLFEVELIILLLDILYY